MDFGDFVRLSSTLVLLCCDSDLRVLDLWAVQGRSLGGTHTPPLTGAVSVDVGGGPRQPPQGHAENLIYESGRPQLLRQKLRSFL